MNHIVRNIKEIKQRITNAALQAHRDPNSIKLLLATKTVSAENIRVALEGGEYLIGENRAQEIKSKYNDLLDIQHEKHFIGHLQTNKIKDLLRYDVSCIQSVDRIDLAERLQKRLEFENKEIAVFIQVNTSNEESKFGIAPEHAIELTRQVAQFPRIHIKGLMTIGLFSAEEKKVRVCFRKLKEIQQEIKARSIPGVEMNELSMGMSHDLEYAIDEGATMVRVGTAIFGKRIYPDSYYWNESR